MRPLVNRRVLETDALRQRARITRNEVGPCITGTPHALVTAVAVAFQFTTVTTVLTGSQAAALSWRRALYLGFAFSLVQSLPPIDLEAIGYLFTNYAIAIAIPGGLGSDPMTISQILSDLWTTMTDVGGKISAAISGWWFIVSIVPVVLSLKAMSKLFSAIVSGWALLALLSATAASFVSLLSGFDTWRGDFFSVWPLSLSADWFAWTASVSWVRLCTPPATALSVVFIWASVPIARAPAAQWTARRH